MGGTIFTVSQNACKRKFQLKIWQCLIPVHRIFCFSLNCGWKRPFCWQERWDATVFWDSQEIVLVDYLGKGKTIKRTYYVIVLDSLKDELKDKCPRLGLKTVPFHQDNMLVHKWTGTVSWLHDFGFKLIPHLPHSPNFTTPCNFIHLNLKFWLRKRFWSNYWVVNPLMTILQFDKVYFSDGIKHNGNLLNQIL